jgi:broad specificity phosphatase PhoE
MIIADELAVVTSGDGLPLGDDDGVVERAYGAAEGVYSAEAARRWPDGRFPGMENDQELAERGAAALRRIAAERSGNGIVVSHGSFIRATIDALCGVDAPRILNGSVSLLRTDGAGWELIDVNRVTDGAGAGLIEHSGG